MIHYVTLSWIILVGLGPFWIHNKYSILCLFSFTLRWRKACLFCLLHTSEARKDSTPCPGGWCGLTAPGSLHFLLLPTFSTTHAHFFHCFCQRLPPPMLAVAFCPFLWFSGSVFLPVLSTALSVSLPFHQMRFLPWPLPRGSAPTNIKCPGYKGNLCSGKM